MEEMVLPRCCFDLRKKDVHGLLRQIRSDPLTNLSFSSAAATTYEELIKKAKQALHLVSSPPKSVMSSLPDASIPSPASLSGLKPSSGTAMYPLHRCKTIHLVRHAQGVHNVEGEKDRSAYTSPAFFDAPITPLGWRQVDYLREHVKNCGLAENIELVICSPLLRTMQTAVGVFGGEIHTGGVGAPPLMVENAGQSERLAISSSNCPPFLAVETCRERLQGEHPCDKRRSITEYRTIFPAIDFSLIENDEDVLWVPDVTEAHKSAAARGMKFMDWLWTREEKDIAIITHSVLLQDTLRMYSKECHPTIRHEMSKRFANCELRSMILVDRSVIGSGSPSLNYPGNIPVRLGLPSDVTDN